MTKDLDPPTCCGLPMRPTVYGMPRFECRHCGKTADQLDDLDAHMPDIDW